MRRKARHARHASWERRRRELAKALCDRFGAYLSNKRFVVTPA